jgi:hypothetical protein
MLSDEKKSVDEIERTLNALPVRIADGGNDGGALPPPKLKYMVLQITDDAGSIDWDWPRFSDQ